MPVKNIHPIIRQVIDRDCHVSESDRAVVRHVISRLKHGYDSFQKMTSTDRRMLIKQSLAQHRANQRLYADVMSGFSTRKLADRQPRQTRYLSPTEIQKLMLENKITEAYIAFRLGWSCGRVKRACQNGMSKPNEIEQWLEAIAEVGQSDVPVESRIRNDAQQQECNFCGYPMNSGDQVFEYHQNVYCSTDCCRTSCGW